MTKLKRTAKLRKELTKTSILKKRSVLNHAFALIVFVLFCFCLNILNSLKKLNNSMWKENLIEIGPPIKCKLFSIFFLQP